LYELDVRSLGDIGATDKLLAERWCAADIASMPATSSAQAKQHVIGVAAGVPESLNERFDSRTYVRVDRHTSPGNDRSE